MDNKNENESGDDFDVELSSTSKSLPLEITNRLIAAQVSKFSGPLPSPEILKAYDSVSPGLAKQIVDQAMYQGNHRMTLEKTVVEGDNRRASWGLILGFILGVLCIGSGTAMALYGHDAAGATVIGTGAASLVGTFVYGTNSRKDERSDKRQKLLGRQDEKQD